MIEPTSTDAAPPAPAPLDRSPLRWLLLATGIAMALYAWQSRQPEGTSDFTIIYRSAARPPAEMYQRRPPIRGNMNPPQFQLLVRPLTHLPLTRAAELWRGLSLAALCVCLWWLASYGREPWTAADYGAALAWAPFYQVLGLNQVTWIIWPLLLWAWGAWRREQWPLGAVGFGLALGLKPFLGVFVLWLAWRRQWRAVALSLLTAGVTLGVGLAVYGVQVTRAWFAAMAGADWPGAYTNASLHGLFDRVFAQNATGAPPLVERPGLAALLSFAAAGIVLMITLVRTRNRGVDDSWPALMASALLASPLGWVYYMWWMLPGTRPSRLLFLSPLLWFPMVLVTSGQPAVWATVTVGSVYTWGLLLAWLGFLRHRVGRIGPDQSGQVVQRDADAPPVG